MARLWLNSGAFAVVSEWYRMCNANVAQFGRSVLQFCRSCVEVVMQLCHGGVAVGA